MRLMRASVVAGMLAAATATPAQAACAISAYTLTTRMVNMAPMVSAKVNGHGIDFLLDSGSFFNGISTAFAAQQRLSPVHVPTTGSRLGEAASGNVTGVAGSSVVSPVVRAKSFMLGETDFKGAIFFTFQELDGGIIGQNFLKQFDVEYDLGKDAVKLLVARNCVGPQIAYWVNGAYAMLPLEKEDGGDHTIAFVTVNGVKLRAMFDTGASGTFITRRAAARAGVNVADARAEPAGVVRGIDRRDVKAWSARFSSIKIGDEEVRNGLLTIGESQSTDFDLLLGADFFLSHHVVVANSQKRIYFTFNGGHVFNPAPVAAGKPSPVNPAPN